MKVYHGADSFPQLKHAVVTTGTFDGVHCGHRKIIDRLVQIAKSKAGETVLFTFYPHPRMVLFPDDHGLQLLHTKNEKIAMLEKAGIDHLVLVEFSKEFSRMSAMEYVRDLLVSKLHVGTMVVGYDHHFGRNREGNYDTLHEYAETYGFGLEQISALDVDEVNVSSTKIRKALKEGAIEKANAYLGYPYPLSGTVVEGKGNGRNFGFPTANLRLEEDTKLVPAKGVYVVQTQVDGKHYRGMLNIGVNPTVSSANVQQIEAHLFDFEDNLYGKRIEVQLLHRLRNEQAFKNVDVLIDQLNNDKRNAQLWLESYSF